MWTNPQETADLVTFTEEIFNKKLHFCVVPGFKKGIHISVLLSTLDSVKVLF